MAYAYRNKGDYDKAIADYTEAIRLDPKYAVAYYSRGCDLPEQGRLRQGDCRLHRAIRLDPKLATAYCNRGVAYWNKGDYDKAIADYTDAIRLDPKPVRRSPTVAEPTGERRLRQGDCRLHRRHPARPETRRRVLQPWRSLREEGRLRQGDCRLHRRHPARHEIAELLQPWHGLCGEGRPRQGYRRLYSGD